MWHLWQDMYFNNCKALLGSPVGSTHGKLTSFTDEDTMPTATTASQSASSWVDGISAAVADAVSVLSDDVIEDVEQDSASGGQDVAYNLLEIDEKYSYIMELGSQSLCFLNREGEVLYASANWESISGMPQSELLSRGMISCLNLHQQKILSDKLISLFDAEEGKNLRRSSDKGRGKKEEFRCQMSRPDSSGYTWMQFSLVRHHEYEDVCVLVARNIEEEIKTERTLRTATIEMELAQKGRYEFLSHMSHEMRTPLNAILGFSEMMEHGVYGEIEQPEYKDYLVNIRGSGQLLLNRIGDMLDIVNMEVGDSSLHESEFTLGELLGLAHKLHRQEAFCRSVEVVLEDNLSDIILCADKAKLAKAVGNLVSNAIRFSHNDARVSISTIQDENGEIRITVQDKGDGMSEGHIAMLKASLSKKDCLFSQDSDAVGVGLGLAVAKEFIALHKGRLDIESTKGEGCVASIVLPASIISASKNEQKDLEKNNI